MAGDVRDRMIRSAAHLVRRHGVRGTTFPLVLEHSRSPRGSVAHHFPGGKPEMLRAAVQASADEVSAALESLIDDGASSAELAQAVCAYFGTGLERSGFRAGCPVAAVAHEPDSDPELLEVARAASDGWLSSLAGVLANEGHADEEARRLATSVLASIEGAIVLARLQGSRRPLEDVVVTIGALIDPGSVATEFPGTTDVQRG